MCVGADVKALAANDAKIDFRRRDPVDRITINVDQTRLAFDGFSLAREFVEGNTPLLDGRDHWRHLIKITGVFFKRGADRGIIQWRHWTLFQRHTGAVLGISRYSQQHRAGVILVFAHEEILNFGSAPEGEQEQTGRDRIKRAAVPDLFYLQPSPDNGDDIVRCHSGRLVDEQDAVWSGS